MRRVTSAGWLALGTALLGGGFAVGVAYWIFTLEDKGGSGFWDVPGFLSVGLLGSGAFALGVGLLRNDRADGPRVALPTEVTRERPNSLVTQTGMTASGGQTTQVAKVVSAGDVTVSPEQRNG